MCCVARLSVSRIRLQELRASELDASESMAMWQAQLQPPPKLPLGRS